MIPFVDKQLHEFVGFPIGEQFDIVIRLMDTHDIIALREISPEAVKNPIEFFAYTTLVAEYNDRIVGYTQFSISIDNVLSSRAIRIVEDMKGHGIGQALLEVKEAIAIKAGARSHLYVVARDGEVALKKILTKMSLHMCQRQGNLEFWVKGFNEENI